MKISIVTPSLNQERYLDGAMTSILQQRHPDTEYIVVDPGSVDGSRELIERRSSHIDQIVFKPDAGPADGLNHGFAKATGDIYGFINADDVLADDALSKIAQAFERYRDVDVISAHGWLIDAAGQRIRRKYSNRFTAWRYVHRGAYLLQQSTFFRAKAFDRAGGFNPDNRTCWDGELWVDMALAGCRFKTVPGFWSSFRVHDGSLSSSIARQTVERRRYDEERARLFRKVTGKEPGGMNYRLMRGCAEIFKWGSSPIALADRCLSLCSARARRCPI